MILEILFEVHIQKNWNHYFQGIAARLCSLQHYFIVAKIWKQPKSPLIYEWKRKNYYTNNFKNKNELCVLFFLLSNMMSPPA